MTTLEQEVQDLKARLMHLETVLHRLVREMRQAEEPEARAPLDQTQLVAWLKNHGLARDPTAEERRVAAEWEALSEQDKQAHVARMHRLRLEPSLSQILIEQRH